MRLLCPGTQGPASTPVQREPASWPRVRKSFTANRWFRLSDGEFGEFLCIFPLVLAPTGSGQGPALPERPVAPSEQASITVPPGSSCLFQGSMMSLGCTNPQSSPVALAAGVMCLECGYRPLISSEGFMVPQLSMQKWIPSIGFTFLKFWFGATRNSVLRGALVVPGGGTEVAACNTPALDPHPACFSQGPTTPAPQEPLTFPPCGPAPHTLHKSVLRENKIPISVSPGLERAFADVEKGGLECHL